MILKSNEISHKLVRSFAILFAWISILSAPAFASDGYVEVQRFCRSGDYTEAIQCLDKLLQNSPRDFRALTDRGAAYCELGNYPGSIKDFEQSLSLTNNKIKKLQIHLWLANCYANMGKMDQAIESCTQAINLKTFLDVCRDDAYALRGRYYLSQGKYEPARADLNKAVDLGDNEDARESLRWLEWLVSNKSVLSDIRDKPASIPFEYKQGYIIVRVNIGETLNVPLLVDTGSSRSIIDSQLASGLHLKQEKSQSKLQSYTGRGIKQRAVTVPLFSINELTFNNLPMRIADIKHITGQQGILGSDFFSQFLTTIDFPNKKLILRDPQETLLNASGINLSTTHGYLNCLYVNGTPAGRNPVQFLVDTGCSINVLPNSSNMVKSETTLIPNLPLSFMDASGRIGKENHLYFKFLNLAESVIPDVVFEVLQNRTIGQSYGLIGNSFLSHYIVSLDYRHNHLNLKLPAETDISNKNVFEGVGALATTKHLLLENKIEEAKTNIDQVIDNSRGAKTLLICASFCIDEFLPDQAKHALDMATHCGDLYRPNEVLLYYYLRAQQKALINDSAGAEEFIKLVAKLSKLKNTDNIRLRVYRSVAQAKANWPQRQRFAQNCSVPKLLSEVNACKLDVDHLFHSPSF